MSEMVERVARAIVETGHLGEMVSESVANEIARAAIEAMREPTDLMTDAGVDAPETSFGDGMYGNPDPADVWRLMIDAALGDAQ